MKSRLFRILIVDDEPNIRSGLARALAHEDYELETAASGPLALEHCRREVPHLIITDLRMPGEFGGLELVRRVHDEWPGTLMLVITAHGTVETAVEAMRAGALDFITKPVDLAMLRMQVRKAFERHQLVEENRTLRERLSVSDSLPEMVGQGSAMRQVLEQIRQVASTDVTVLVQGESGTGKELVARAIHQLSARAEQAFVAANIAALPESLIESELFGYEKGAFTGASRQKPGWFEMAQHGTLFLDEIGEMPARTQVDLLRVLEQREMRRLGGEEVLKLDVRVIAATHQDMEELTAEGRFREDLYYRLNVVPIAVPPLRQRRDDIPLLADHFLRQAEERHHKDQKQIAPAAMRILCDYTWPGNVRQLRNVMERLVVTVEEATIRVDHLPVQLRQAPPRSDVVTLEEAVTVAEKAAILAALNQTGQHREKAAKLLNVSVRTLHYKMSRYEMQ